MGEVRFLLDDRVETLVDPDPTGTLLDWLRSRRGRVGTKEGCAEGDCGACTVLVGTIGHGEDGVAWRAVNACILFLPMLDGKALRTIESLAGVDGALHPIQRAFVDAHASQCGFCTPGFVMSVYAKSLGARGTRGMDDADLLAGNLCRCTGYGPLLDVAGATEVAEPDDRTTAAMLRSIRRDAMLAVTHVDGAGGRRRWLAPRTVDELVAVLAEMPDARIVAGATDVGLWVTKGHRVIETVVAIADIAELALIDDRDDSVSIGAAARYADAYPALARLDPQLGALVRRIGGPQVRNAGTIGGNIANGSPIGDMPPALIALGATVTLRRGDARRTLPLEAYFLAYGRQDRQPGEFVERLFVPRPAAGTRLHITKLSKRFDSDISAVCGAIALTVRDGVVTAARIAFGGMAGTPQRAIAAEAALTGAAWAEAAIEAAVAALADDFRPLTDVRGSAAYRLAVAGNLLRRLWIEEQGDEPVSVLDARLLADG